VFEGIQDGGDVWARAFAEVIRPRERLSLSAWADRYRQLAGKAASEPGQWRTDRAPYLREPMDALTDDEVEEVVMWFGTQLGKSETCNNWIGFTIDHNPGPIMLVQPTLDTAKRYSKQRVAALIEATPALRDKVKPARARDSGNTLLEKEFDGGILIITGANSAAGLRSMPARDLLFDEIDAYGLSVDDEGDPISIAEKRQDTFARRKRLKTSTCTVKGESRIEQAYQASDRRRYWVPCPHCGERQVLKWAQLKWVDDDPATARYACEHCGALIDESAKSDMLAGGQWRAEEPASRVRGYWLNSLYSPLGWLSWSTIVAEFLAAKAASAQGDSTLLQVWTNTRLAETWELKGATVADAEVQKRAENYPLRSVPRGCLLVTASVDVQGDRLEYALHGWGRGEECWVIDYGKLYGDPALDTVWRQLDELLAVPLTNAWGIALRPRAVVVDSGGHHAAMVYAMTRARAGRHWIAVKGQSQPGKPVIGRPTEIDASWKGKKIKAGARVWPVGSDTAKHVLYQRLALTQAGPGFIHTSVELPDEWFKGLTAETLITRYVKGRPRSEWHVKKGLRNEPLDLWVYGYAGAQYLGMGRWREREWDWLAQQVEPPLFEPDASPGATAAGAGGADQPATQSPAPNTARARRVGRIGRLRT
jgi:phage terminase large subunit GpA-like protein